jgi:hypothetical protein
VELESQIMNINEGKCPVCSAKRETYFRQKILKKYEVDYLYCPSCGLLQTETPYWLDEAYSNAIANADTGLVARNISISQKIAPILFFYFNPNGKYLDIAGGYGMLTRLMRDIGFDFYWFDPYCENILAKGFEFDSNTKPCTAVTAFEVLEHVTDPIKFIQDALEMGNTSTIILSTELFNGSPPSAKEWDYYSFETGQHISFYQPQTIEKIASTLQLNYYYFRGISLLTSETLSNSNMINMMTGKANFLLLKYIKNKLQSKTLKDYKYMLKK